MEINGSCVLMQCWKGFLIVATHFCLNCGLRSLLPISHKGLPTKGLIRKAISSVCTLSCRW